MTHKLQLKESHTGCKNMKQNASQLISQWKLVQTRITQLTLDSEENVSAILMVSLTVNFIQPRVTLGESP